MSKSKKKAIEKVLERSASQMRDVCGGETRVRLGQNNANLPDNFIEMSKDLHGDIKNDMNRHVPKPTDSNLEDELMRNTLNGMMLHMNVDREKYKKYKDIADQIPDLKTARKEFIKKCPEMKPVLCLCRIPRPKPDPVPSHIVKKSALSNLQDLCMPSKPPPHGYRWSFRQIGCMDRNGSREAGFNDSTNGRPSYRWVLVPTNLGLKRKKGYDYYKDAKYGYRNQMDPGDFKIGNRFNFPPFCYPIVEPLQFPFKNFNAPPYKKRAPLHFLKTNLEDKVEDDDEFLRALRDPPEELTDEERTALHIKEIRRMTDDALKKDFRGKRRYREIERDPWAGYKPKFIKMPVNRMAKYKRPCVGDENENLACRHCIRRGDTNTKGGYANIPSSGYGNCSSIPPTFLARRSL